MKRDALQRQRELESAGWSIKSDLRNCVRDHSGNESLYHWFVKAEVARQASNHNHTYWTEAPLGSVATDADYADVLIARESQQNGIVVEVETGLTKERKREKVEQYYTDFIQDVLVINPDNAPIRLPDIEGWVEDKLAGFI